MVYGVGEASFGEIYCTGRDAELLRIFSNFEDPFSGALSFFAIIPHPILLLQ